MLTLFIAVGSFVGFIVAYHTYGRWLSRHIFQIDSSAVVPSVELRDDVDYVPTNRHVLFGHHFTSIAGTGPIVGPAIAVFWGWLPALLWVVLGSIFVGAVHDFGALVISLRNRGQTIGEVAGRLINPRATAVPAHPVLCADDCAGHLWTRHRNHFFALSGIRTVRLDRDASGDCHRDLCS